ncbi:hypothetical protein niasHT_036824 [Heterodera trifolii]|uniref:Innexin n=1 Tax=Heterodera trifolii TaxID=157864 RepID=A0ABD2INT4_9BILA
MDSLYLALFSSTDSETTFQAEIFLGLKLMVTLIDQAEKAVINPANFTEIITTRAKLRAMMAVQLHFRNAEKFRIICYQIAYVTYLVQKKNLPSTVWQSPTQCFLKDREDILSSMRTVLQSSHLNFVMSHVNGGPVGNSISDTVWHKRGALALLEKLIGGAALIKLWENKEARTKLIEANFFLDKKRLVEHYLSALLTSDIAADSVDRTRRDIKSADLIVWAQWFQSLIEQQHKGKSRHSIHRDYVWMYLRIAYDLYELGTEKSEFEHTFTKMEKMMRKITKLLISAGDRRGSLMGKLREKWDVITEVFAGSNLELEESVEQEMDIMEFIQQLHHRVIRELWQSIRLKESENCRNNLASFLSKEQMREIFQFIGIPLEKEEFEGTAQKMAFPSDDQTEKGKDQQKKKQRKNRRKKNGQKLGMIEENESEKGEEKTESKSEEKGKSEKESDEKWTKIVKEKEEKEEKGEEKEKEASKRKKENEKSRENGKEKEEKEEKGEEKENIKREKENGKTEENSEYISEEKKKVEEKEKLEKEKNQKLLNQMMANDLTNEFAGCLSPAFPKISQQLIRDEFDEQNSQKLEQFVEEMAINGKTMDGISRKNRDKRIKAAVGTINGITANWSIDKAKLLISGSFMFGLNTTDSDIDLICVVPGKVIKKEHFLGEQNEICVEKKCQKGEDGEKQNMSIPKAFYCHLCENEKVNDLLKISHGQLLMLKFTFDGFDFDISFVAIPKLETLEQRITDRTLRNYLTKFDTENVEHRQMIRVLTSYISNVHIIKLMDENQKKTFIPNCDISEVKMRENGRNYENLRYLILALKLWAKANFIYSNKFGFLNGVILTIMATKIALLYPNSSLYFLLCKFFLIYAARPFGLPIQLEQINEKSKANPFLSKNPMENEIKIYTAVFPQQNAARLITSTNAKIIRNEMTEALNKLINFGGHLFDWSSLLSPNSIDFVEKYENFVVINCLGKEKISVQKFCQFVETRIRLQLEFDINNRGTTTNWHIYPALFQETCQITQKLEEIPAKNRSDFDHCKVWLIGTDQQLLNANEKQLINGKLLNFDWAIKRDFLKFNGKLSNKSGGDDINVQFEQMGLNLKSVFDSAIFPRITLCDIQIRRLGDTPRYTLQCHLRINTYNEKIYLFIWWGFGLVAILTTINFVYYLFVLLLFPWTQERSVRHLLKQDKYREIVYSNNRRECRLIRRFAEHALRKDGILLFWFIEGHAGPIVARELMGELFEIYKTDMHEEDDEQPSEVSVVNEKVKGSFLAQNTGSLGDDTYGGIAQRFGNGISPSAPHSKEKQKLLPNGNNNDINPHHYHQQHNQNIGGRNNGRYPAHADRPGEKTTGDSRRRNAADIGTGGVSGGDGGGFLSSVFSRLGTAVLGHSSSSPSHRSHPYASASFYGRTPIKQV